MGNHHSGPHSAHRPRKNVHWKAAEWPQPPGKPDIVPGAGGEQTAVALRWAPPRRDGGAPVTGYHVECNRLGSPLWVRTAPQVVLHPELILTGLEPGYEYQFRISAENAVGVSVPSEISDVLTVSVDRSAISIPKFIRGLHDIKTMENDRTEFNVTFEGSPPPTVSWFKDGFEIFSSRRTVIVTDNTSSTLIFHQTSLNDEGEIKCSCTNRAGHAVSRARLSLEAAPRVRLPRQYEDGLLHETGETVFLKVSVAGKPTPHIEWWHDGRLMENEDRIQISDTDKFSTVRITEASRNDRGEYQIVAKNSLGEDSASFLVTITARPDPPVAVSVAQNPDRSVSLSWVSPDDDGGCQVGNYIIEYYRTGWDVWLKAATSRKLTATLFDLIEGSEYRFRVKAESPYGVSEPSAKTERVFIPGKSGETTYGPLDLEKSFEFIKSENKDDTPQFVPRRKRPMSPNNDDVENAHKYTLDIPASITLRKQRIVESSEKHPNSTLRDYNTEQRKYSFDDKMKHGSSEFMLVLYPEGEKSTEDKRKSFQLDLEDAMSPPPISLSAPELGYGNFFPIRPLRNSVSSTELLHEHAMDRFYQVVALKEAEKAKANKESRRSSAIEKIPEIKINQNFKNSNDIKIETNTKAIENKEEKQEEINSEMYETDDATVSNESLSREKSEENNSQFEDDYTASTVSTGDSEFSDSDSLEEDVTKLRTRLEESTTYHPNEMVFKGIPQTHSPPGQAVEVLTKPAPLPDPNFIPKPILKKREPDLPLPSTKEEKPIKSSENLMNKVPLFKKFAKFPKEKQIFTGKKGSSNKKEKKSTSTIQKSINSVQEKAPIIEKDKKTQEPVVDVCQDEGRSVIEHYGNLVKEFGGTKKPQRTLYTNTEELKKAAAVQQKSTEKTVNKQPIMKKTMVPKNIGNKKETIKSIPRKVEGGAKNGEVKTNKKTVESQKPKLPISPKAQTIEIVSMPKNFSELNAEAESNIRSLFNYIIDICMLIVAFWLYIFKDERLAIPFLGLTMYRQLNSAIRNKMPSWLTKQKPAIE